MAFILAAVSTLEVAKCRAPSTCMRVHAKQVVKIHGGLVREENHIIQPKVGFLDMEASCLIRSRAYKSSLFHGH